MRRRINTYLILSFTAIFAVQSCVAVHGAKKKPKWVSGKPFSNEYYTGIGKSNKSTKDYLQAAKNNALADLISEISVNISTNSLLHQFEDNTGFKERYEAFINLSAKNNIDGYELVDTYEDKTEYWVYYRLSKAEYAKKKREKLERAKNLSKDYFEKAKASEKIYDINNAIIFYVKAFDAIKNHLDEDLSVFILNDGKVYLDNAIFQSIQSIFSNIKIAPGKDIFSINTLSADNEPVFAKIKFKTTLETQNLNGMPIIFYFPELEIDALEKVISKNNGDARCTIANMAPKGRTQTIKAELDIDNYFGSDAPENFLKQMFTERGTIPYGNIIVEVNELFAYLESEELIFEKSSARKPVTNIFKTELSENFFSFTKNKETAKVLIKIKSSIIEGEKLGQYNLHTAYLDCNISISNLDSGIEIFNDGFNNLKGMKSGSFNNAAENAIEKAKEKIKNEIIPVIRKINL